MISDLILLSILTSSFIVCICAVRAKRRMQSQNIGTQFRRFPLWQNVLTYTLCVAVVDFCTFRLPSSEAVLVFTSLGLLACAVLQWVALVAIRQKEQ